MPLSLIQTPAHGLLGLWQRGSDLGRSFLIKWLGDDIARLVSSMSRSMLWGATLIELGCSATMAKIRVLVPEHRKGTITRLGYSGSLMRLMPALVGVASPQSTGQERGLSLLPSALALSCENAAGNPADWIARDSLQGALGLCYAAGGSGRAGWHAGDRLRQDQVVRERQLQQEGLAQVYWRRTCKLCRSTRLPASGTISASRSRHTARRLLRL